MIVANFWKTWSWLVASFGLVLPELVQVIADHTTLIPYVTAETKDTIRLVALLLVVVLRPIRQRSLN